MDRWSSLTLRDAGVKLIDCVHKTPAAQESGYPYVGIPQMRDGWIDFDSARKISREDFCEWTKKAKPQQHDVVLSRRTNPGVTAIDRTGTDFALGQNLVLLRADGCQIDPPFLKWLARSPAWWEQIEKFKNVGAVFDSLKCADVPNFELPVPPIKTQRMMGGLFDAIDAKIDLNRRMNKTLEAMARAIFKDWFVHFGPTRAKAEGDERYLAPKLWDLFPDSFDDQEKPEGWEIRKLEAILKLNYGKSLPARKRTPGNVAVYGSGGIAGTHDVALIEGPAVIVGRKGTVGSLYWEDDSAFPIDTVFYVVPRIGSVLFAYHLLATLPLRDMNTDAAVPGLNRNNAYRLEFPLPSFELISAFENISGALWKRRAKNLVETKTLTQTRDLLLPKLMSGEIRLREAERMVEAVA